MSNAQTTPAVDPDAKIVHKPQLEKVKPGELITLIHYVKVKEVDVFNQSVVVENLDDRGKYIKYQGKELISNGFSADQFEEEKVLSRTKVARMLMNHCQNRPITVNFVKKDGTERTMRGRLLDNEDDVFGYSLVEDLDCTDAHRIRQVDRSTLNWLIVDGVKYTVKTK
jgi:hypothetical protein